MIFEPRVTSEGSVNDLVQSDEATDPAAEDFDNHDQNAAGTFLSQVSTTHTLCRGSAEDK